jgi:hypothetical protein
MNSVLQFKTQPDKPDRARYSCVPGSNRWDPAAERIVDDEQAQGVVARQRRKGFEIEC